jgi:hypothetical protein
MRGHGLRVFERAARLEIGGDARRAEHMAPELPLEAGLAFSVSASLTSMKP